MSSSSSYSSSSPPSSPQCNSSSNSSTNTTTPLAADGSGYQRANSTTNATTADSILKTIKIRPHMVQSLVEKNGGGGCIVDDTSSPPTWDHEAVDKEKCSSGIATAPSSATTSTISNDESSKESLDNEFTHHHDAKMSDEGVIKPSEDIEATYMTSVSKNLVTLRKTESLKLDSVQSIRNRFDRINTNTLSSLSRNRANKSLKGSDMASSDALRDNSRGNDDLLGRPSSPPIILARNPHLHNQHNQDGGKSLPLHINTLTSSAQYDVATTAAKITMTMPPDHHYTSPVTFSAQPANTLFLSSSGNSVIKKRVWTPVSTGPNADSKSSLDSNGLSHSSFAELQKSYFRLLEEKNSLKEQLNIQEKKYKRLEEDLKIKDKRILNLENKLNVLMIDSGQIADTTDC